MRHDDPDRNEAIGAAIRRASESVEAPDRLRLRVAGERERRPTRGRTKRRLAVGFATVAVGAGVGVVWMAERASTPPTVSTVAAATLAPTSGSAPGRDPGDGEYLTAQVDGVRFPSYAELPGWRVAGSRSERLSGRTALTVTYVAGDVRFGYTVVDGPALAIPSGASRVRASGVEAAILPVAHGSAVTWRSGGHTCVLASPTASAARLLRLIPEQA
jgi:hypothetical protein